MPRGSQRCRGIHILRCPFAGCPKTFRGKSSHTNHVQTVHPRHMQHRAPASDSDIQVSLPTPSRSSLPYSPQAVYQPQVGSHSPSPEIELPQEPQEGQQQTLKTYHPFLNGEYYLLL